MERSRGLDRKFKASSLGLFGHLFGKFLYFRLTFLGFKKVP